VATFLECFAAFIIGRRAFAPTRWLATTSTLFDV
jgi:hypothetical protein